MEAAAFEGYQEDSLYKEMMVQFQRGEWREGLLTLNQLIEKYPLEHELRSLRHEMQLRASIDVYEETDRKSASQQRARRVLLRALLAALIIGAIFIGAGFSANWLRQRASQAQQIVLEQQRTFSLANKYEQAMQLASAYRFAEANVLLKEIQQTNPDYPGLTEAFQSTESIKILDETYQKALAAKLNGDWQAALALFETVPNYRDSTLQIQEIRRDFTLADLMLAGDEAVRSGQWEEAIAQYEALRNQDFLYQREQLEERLYNSYINAAKGVLEDQPDSLEALQKARDYFSKALSVRPQDPQVFEELAVARETVADRLYTQFVEEAKKALIGRADSITALREAEDYFSQAAAIRPNDPDIARQRKMAASYIQAMVDFNKSKWDAVIKNLQYVFEQDVDYTEGTARQALYDAYIARGDGFLINGRAQSALVDYQNAVAIAQLRPDSLLRLFEAQARVGDALGVMGNYQTAVYQYRAALEEASILQSVILDPELDRTLKNAEANAVRGRFRNAYNLYRAAMGELVASLQTVTHTVTGEDYLASLAKEYGTTVSAILAANRLTDPASIAVGDKLIIPVLATQ